MLQFDFQILREINFGESGSCKNAVFAILGALNFVSSAKIHKNLHSEPLKMADLEILWFHVKSEWQEKFLWFPHSGILTSERVSKINPSMGKVSQAMESSGAL